MDKMAALHHEFTQMGMLAGTTSSYMEQMKAKDKDAAAELPVDHNNGNDDDDDGGPSSGTPSGALSEVKLAAKPGVFKFIHILTAVHSIIFSRTSLSSESP